MTEHMIVSTQSSSGPEFRAFRKRLLTGGLVLCVLGLPVGLVLKLPGVWALAIAGIVVAGLKLATARR